MATKFTLTTMHWIGGAGIAAYALYTLGMRKFKYNIGDNLTLLEDPGLVLVVQNRKRTLIGNSYLVTSGNAYFPPEGAWLAENEFYPYAQSPIG